MLRLARRRRNPPADTLISLAMMGGLGYVGYLMLQNSPLGQYLPGRGDGDIGGTPQCTGDPAFKLQRLGELQKTAGGVLGHNQIGGNVYFRHCGGAVSGTFRVQVFGTDIPILGDLIPLGTFDGTFDVSAVTSPTEWFVAFGVDIGGGFQNKLAFQVTLYGNNRELAAGRFRDFAWDAIPDA